VKLLLVAAAALVVAIPPAAAGPNLIIGVTEDGLRLEPQAAGRDALALGLDAVRITLRWRSGQRSLNAVQRRELANATSVPGLRVVLSVFGERAADAPRTEAARARYCGFLGSILDEFPSIRDVVVWNEPNKTFFWRPQFDARGRSVAPRDYAALLGRCWDVLHAAREDVTVLAPSTAPRGNDNPDARSNVSHSPVRFLQELGRAHRESGRARPLFDSVAHHVHGFVPGERPWRQHPGRGITQGDYERLVSTLQAAFAGTRQPVPGRCMEGRCAGIWYLEAGFQTTPDAAKSRAYTGSGVADRGLPDATGPVDLQPLPPASSPAPDQASQLAAAVRLASCQPHVQAFFNFLLWDEARLEGWQSGLYWVDRTPKGSVPAFRAAVEEARAGRTPCARLRAELPGSVAPTAAPTTTTSAAAPTPAPAPEPTSTGERTSTGLAAGPGRPADGDDDALSIPLVAAGIGAFLLGAAGAALLARRRTQQRRISR
jgi:hypothetical protein